MTVNLLNINTLQTSTPTPSHFVPNFLNSPVFLRFFSGFWILYWKSNRYHQTFEVSGFSPMNVWLVSGF